MNENKFYDKYKNEKVFVSLNNGKTVDGKLLSYDQDSLTITGNMGGHTLVYIKEISFVGEYSKDFQKKEKNFNY